MVVNKLSWMTGGAQGSGVDSAANIFGRSCTLGGLHVYGKREYYSNIIGAHSYFQIRVDEKPIRSHVDTIDMLVTFDEETLFRHYGEVVKGGAILYDPALVEMTLSRIPTLEPEVISKITAELNEFGLPPTVKGILSIAEQRGAKLFPIPFAELLGTLEAEMGKDAGANLKKTVNTMAVVSSLGILEFDFDMIVKGIEVQFSAKRKVVSMNVKAAEKAYEYANREYSKQFTFRLKKIITDEKRLYLQGTQAVALGKLAGGCTFQTYYPITPASDESVYLEAHETFRLTDGTDSQEGSIVVVQTEDEIAAITMAVGAALSGARAATATSGPGFSLMAEGTGWAGMNEVPVVITVYSRGGPATGLPTRHEQGDLLFSLYAAHGEFPRLVLASGDMEEAFYDAVRAFNYAEQFQTPVVHLIDKALANSTQTYPMFDTRKVIINRGELLAEDAVVTNGSEMYKRFELTEDGISPRARLGTAGAIYWNTGDEHDELGHITEDPENRNRMMEKRMKKLETAAQVIPLEEKVNFFGPKEADATIVSWGTPKGAILDAMELFEKDGLKVNFLQVRLIHPFPVEYVSGVLNRAKRKINVEMNFSGQFASLVRQHTGIAMDHLIVKYNGRPISRDEIYESVTMIMTNPKAPRKVVLQHGA
ncbi:MAG: 2-oxoacid:acceptor oxidoreductase subunit alpha [Ignavibacteriae bacterium]|nr:2-oxoacid:acceptor oxidoreductase subunit alpha [Ignavibacteriota bacterium]